MLPKNKLRRKRLERLRVFEDTNTGGLLKNVIKRYDNIIIPTSAKPVAETSIQTLEGPDRWPSAPVCTIAKRQDDTPALGSLGGLKPSYMSTPKEKKRKEKKKQTPPGLMKIFDESGNEVGKAHWKQRKPN